MDEEKKEGNPFESNELLQPKYLGPNPFNQAMVGEQKVDIVNPPDLIDPPEYNEVSNFVTKQKYPKYTGDNITFSEKKTPGL